MIGRSFNRLTVTGPAPRKSSGDAWQCVCRCGQTLVVRGYYLRSGHTKSCGCIKKDVAATRVADIAGKRFGRLVAIRRIPSACAKAVWECKCDCGKTGLFQGDNLRTGHTQSCGCLAKEWTSRAKRTHGRCGTVEYRTYWSMVNRCSRPSAGSYQYYGARGIRVADEWLGPGGFEKFLQHVGPRPSKHHSIDRIDFNGNYGPGNVKWSTTREQARNHRRNVFLTADGRTQTITDWAAEVGMKHHTLASRIRSGWPHERAIGEPVKRPRGH